MQPTKPLDGTKVLDVTQVLSGPFASMLLADMGADVVKIERPDTGDVARGNAPFVGDQSAYFISVNRNKRSVALDLKSDEGREAFLRLAEKADVIVENYQPGTMERFGLGYEAIRKRNEQIVYCSISGFGQSGPYADRPALDIIVQAMSGNMSITGPEDSKPYRSGIPIADIAGSMYAVQSILGALLKRGQTGSGQYIDISMMDALVSWLTVRTVYTFAMGDPYPRNGNKLSEYVPYGVFETSDGYLALVALHDRHWRQICDLLGMPELGNDERYATLEKRLENRVEVEALIQEKLVERPSQEWFELLSTNSVPAGPILNTLEVWDDPHVQSRNLLSQITVDDESFDVIKYPVPQFSSEITTGVPDIGEHSYDELRAAGYSDEEIAALESQDVVRSID